VAALFVPEKNEYQKQQAMTIFIMGLCILLRVLSKFVSKTVLRDKCSRCFYILLFIATCLGLSDGHPQANRIK
jgi:membrane protein CcdC involved in cytochrome C biogenesis